MDSRNELLLLRDAINETLDASLPADVPALLKKFEGDKWAVIHRPLSVMLADTLNPEETNAA